MHPYNLHARESSVRWWFENNPLPKSWKQVYNGDIEQYFLPLGSHEVFGMASDDGVQLWFFNPTFAPDLPGVEPFRAMEERG